MENEEEFNMIDPVWAWTIRTLAVVVLGVLTWYEIVSPKVPVVVILGMLAWLFIAETWDAYKQR